MIEWMFGWLFESPIEKELKRLHSNGFRFASDAEWTKTAISKLNVALIDADKSPPPTVLEVIDAELTRLHDTLGTYRNPADEPAWIEKQIKLLHTKLTNRLEQTDDDLGQHRT